MKPNHTAPAPRAQAAPETPRRGLTRRQLAAGTAWSVPVVAASMAAPAHASSPDCTNGEQTWDAIGVYPFVVPPGCNTIEFSIAGAEGGFYLSSGAGALFTGAIVRDGTVPLPLTIVIGGAGTQGSAASVWPGGVGYGNGGDTATAPAKAFVQVGSGGGGSAILQGTDATVDSNPPLIVAGGGGGGNWSSGKFPQCSESDCLFQGIDGAAGRPGPGHGGLNGQDAAQGRLGFVGPPGVRPPDPLWYTLSINGGHGASGSTGGAAGAPAVSTLVDPTAFSSRNVDPPMHREYVGTAGGDTGTGNYGGGNGGTGAAPWGGEDVSADPTLADWMTSGAGGGGGYAGGGGGGNGWIWDPICGKRISYAGAGGGGSSFTGGTAEHRVVVATSGIGTKSTSYPCSDGAVTLKW